MIRRLGRLGSNDTDVTHLLLFARGIGTSRNCWSILLANSIDLHIYRSTILIGQPP